jgi:UDP-N-acetylmuramoyl-tripeptide--D-alanyl-D-alanine ligase
MLKSLSHLGAIAAVIGVESAPQPDAVVSGCSIDSRTIRPGELFFAVRGERTDGHLYVDQALAAGAVAAVVERDTGGCGRLVVRDSLAALQTLGAETRRRWGKRVVAVTGSAGKTTTKEMIAAVLGRRLQVRRTEGNLNNHFGLPLSLLQLEDADQAAVFELAMSHAGEVAQLAAWARPDVGVVTCVAPVHLEFFSSLEDIARAKYELVEALRPDQGGVAVLNADDPLVSAFAYRGRTVTFGLEKAADFQATAVTAGAVTKFEARGVGFELALPGRHQILNALGAIAVGSLFEVSAAEAAAALRGFQPATMRGETLEWNGATIINDCYNSNPRALRGMLEWLAQAPARGRRIAVLGEMLELGPAGPALHREAGTLAARSADFLVGVRGLAAEMVAAARSAGLPAARARLVESPEEAADVVAEWIAPGDVALFKASRGVKLERAIAALRARRGVEA